MVDFTFAIADFEYLLMIFVRIATFVFAAPFFGMTGVPGRVKIGFSALVAILMFYSMPNPGLEYTTVIEYAGIVLKEATVGLAIGFVANIVVSIVSFAGRMMDMDMGLSMMTMFDPISKENTSITGTLYYYLVLLMMLVTNMHSFVLGALIDSYDLIPIDAMVADMGKLYDTALQFLTDYIVIGFRIALPIFASMLLLNVVLGILAKIAPQMNMFAVGMQLKLLLGFLVLFLVIGLIPNVTNFIIRETKVLIVAVIEGL